KTSDLTLLCKANMSIGAGNILFVRFIMGKTFEGQLLSRFPGTDFAMCPLLAFNLALITQQSPAASILSQLPEQHLLLQSALTPAMPLIYLIEHPGAVSSLRKRAIDNPRSCYASPGIVME
ncbi:hypothetical protein PHMEG_00040685, partial [Phytophthora megakarya]